jgi:hypothetical protein
VIGVARIAGALKGYGFALSANAVHARQVTMFALWATSELFGQSCFSSAFSAGNDVQPMSTIAAVTGAMQAPST